MDTALVYFLEDSVRVSPVGYELFDNDRKVSFSYPFKAASQYFFKADPGAFKDVFGLYSDTLSMGFSLQEDEHYGSLSLTIEPTEMNDSAETKILQLLDSKGTIVSEKSYTTQISHTFRRLHPGKYSLKVIFDKNKNGKWDTGTYRERAQAELISLYPEEIEIRSNWEFDVDWTPTVPTGSSNSDY